MRDALEHEAPELLHEWRKQAKYHALQARLMRQQFPDALDKRVAGVRDLAELLGEVQDIEVVVAGAKGWRERPSGIPRSAGCAAQVAGDGRAGDGGGAVLRKAKGMDEGTDPAGHGRVAP